MGRALSRDSRDRVVADVKGALSCRRAAERFGVSAVCFPINHPDRESQQRRAGSAIAVRLPITGPSALHQKLPFRRGERHRESASHRVVFKRR
jgi:hypothetical protein